MKIANFILILSTLGLCRGTYYGPHYIDPSCWQEEAPQSGEKWTTETLCHVACDLQNKDSNAPPCTGVRFDAANQQCFIGHISCSPVVKISEGQGLKVWIDLEVPSALPQTSPHIAIFGGWPGAPADANFHFDYDVEGQTDNADLPQVPFDSIETKWMPAMVYDNTFMVCGGVYTDSCWKHKIGSTGWVSAPAMPRVRGLASYAQVGPRLWVLGGKRKPTC